MQFLYLKNALKTVASSLKEIQQIDFQKHIIFIYRIKVMTMIHFFNRCKIINKQLLAFIFLTPT